MTDHIIGHKKQREEIVRLITSGRSHAFLLMGPDMLGKRTIAFAIADRLARGKALESEGLSHVDSLGVHPTVQVLAPEVREEKGKVTIKKIPVSAVRETTRQLAFRAGTDTYNVLIIDDAQEMHTAAYNALLKVIEEPPERTVIFVVTSDPGRIPPTVVSRMSRITFVAVTDDLLQELTDDNVLHGLAFGRPGALIRYRDDPDARVQAEESLALLTQMRNLRTHERLAHAERLSVDVPTAIAVLSLWVQRIYHVAHTSETYGVLPIAKKVDDAIHVLQTSNANRRLVLEELFVRL